MEQARLTEMKEEFIRLLKKTERPGVDKLIDWIETTDFYTAPASTRFHGNYEGGLLEHSLNVYTALLNLSMCTSSVINEEDVMHDDTMIITALLHDLCKANTYKTAQRWRKDANNRWESYDTFEFNEDEPLGHGEKSVYIIQRAGMELMDDEVYMIRWHMGGFESNGNYMTLSSAMSKCPGITLIHAADLIATNIMENKKLKGDESHA